ncbi:MAG: PhoH family protein [Bacteroidetes bacterium]|nr:PhoH family protein [Bacteroidota bacterium]
MSEKTIALENINPVDILGVNDKNIELLKHFFSKIKIISRGEEIKIIGEQEEISIFEKKFQLIITHFEKFGKVNENDIMEIMENDDFFIQKEQSNDTLVHGRNGLIIKARTPNQLKMVEACNQNDLVFAIGPAGTGKTYTAVALAVRALKNKEIRRIVLTRPAVEAGENLGFLPGDLRDKLDPYLQPLYDALRDMIPTQKLLSYWEDGTIEIAPLAFMRGRTLDHAFVILDEAQNATEGQLKMFLTRMGKSAKFIVTGDITQIDLPRNQSSGLIQACKILQNVNGLSFVFLDKQDIIRHKLVTKIINAYDANSNSL